MRVIRKDQQGAGGLRAIVELVESAPPPQREKIINEGLARDPARTLDALKYVMSFDDIVCLQDAALTEVLALTPPLPLSHALRGLDGVQQARFVRCAPGGHHEEVGALEPAPVTADEIIQAQLKVVGIARELERKGLLNLKGIPKAA